MKQEGTAGASPGTGQNPELDGTLPREFFRFYRGLLGQIETALPGQQTKVLLLSSSGEGEGTTEVGVSLAISLAMAMGRRTAIVDSNLYHPEIHARFGTPEIGLTEYLAGQIGLKEALVNTVVPKDQILLTAKDMASQIAALDPLVIRAVKQAVSRGLDLPMTQAMELEKRLALGIEPHTG